MTGRSRPPSLWAYCPLADTLVAAGTGYEADDILSASSTNIGGTGGGFQVAINLNTIANAVPVFRPLTAADIPELDAGLF